MTEQPARPTLLRSVLGVAATIIILAAMRYGSPILNPVLLGIFIALLVSPVHAWLRRKLPAWLAVIALLVGLVLLGVGMFLLFAISATRLHQGLTMYATELQTQIDQIAAALSSAENSAVAASTASQALIAILTFVADSALSFASYWIPAILICLFAISEGNSLINYARANLPAKNSQLEHLMAFGNAVVRQFGVRAIVNAITGTGFTILLLLLGVDYAALWGILTFFLSYIPYIGIVIAGTPAVILAFAEFGLDQALLVIAALAIVNISAENLLAPALMGRALHISTTLTFIGFMFWLWLLGGPGAFLAMPMTILALLILDSFPETQWLARIFMRPIEQPPSKAPAVSQHEQVQVKGADER